MAKRRALPKAAHSIKFHRHAGALLGIFFCLATQAAPAPEDEARWYQIELIAFAHKDPQALDDEQWPEVVGVDLPLDQLIELTLPADVTPEDEMPAPAENPAVTTDADPGEDPAAETGEEAAPLPVAYEILGEDQWQLAETEQRLRRSPRFEPLLHVAWRQPTLGRDRARPVLLYDGMTTPLPPLPADTAATGIPPGEMEEPAAMTTEQAEPVPATEQDAEIGPPNPRLVGTVRVSVARYLHFATDLTYRLPVTQREAVPVPDLDLWYDRPYPVLYEPQGPAYRLREWQAIRGFRMTESRRMRSKVLHYLDHPLFGVVVLITPVELPAPTEEEPDPATM